MKKIIVILQLSMLIILYSCQYKEYYDNGVLKTIGALKNKKKIGEWKYYSDNEKLYLIENYKNGIRDGQIKNYYKNGNIMFEGIIKKDGLIGKWKYYYENGQIESEGLYGINREKDTWLLFSENFPMELIFLKGEKQGFRYHVNPNFIRKSDIEKETNQWNNNKQKILKIPNKEGEWKYYFNNGKVKKEEIYLDDNVITACEYYENEQLKYHSEGVFNVREYVKLNDTLYHKGSENYSSEFYSESGQLTKENYINNGDTININYKNGQLKTKKNHFKNGNSSIEFYKNGQLKIKMTDNNKKRNSQREVYENGQLKTKETHLKNNNILTERYKNGQLQTKTTNNIFKKNSKKEVYKNGRLETIHIYTHKDHRLKVYDKSGKLISNDHILLHCDPGIPIMF